MYTTTQKSMFPQKIKHIETFYMNSADNLFFLNILMFLKSFFSVQIINDSCRATQAPEVHSQNI